MEPPSDASSLNFFDNKKRCVYWVKYAKRDSIEILKALGKAGRVTNIHIKDMKDDPKSTICPLGDGIIDFKPIVDVCNEYNVQNALVEQDNAPDLGDEYQQMKKSFEAVKELFI